MVSVRYLVKDVEASIKFYSDSLGFELSTDFVTHTDRRWCCVYTVFQTK